LPSAGDEKIFMTSKESSDIYIYNPIIFLLSANDYGGVTKVTLNICKELKKMNIPCEIHVPYFTHYYYTKTLRTKGDISDIKLWIRYVLGQLRLEFKQRKLKFCGTKINITDVKVVRYFFYPSSKRLRASKVIVIQQSTILQQILELGITNNKIMIVNHHLFTKSPSDLESTETKHPVQIVVSSKFTANEIEEIGIKKYSLIHLGVDLETFNPRNRIVKNSNRVNIGIYFHMHQRKNPKLIVEIVQQLTENRNIDIEIQVFGNPINRYFKSDKVTSHVGLTESEYARLLANCDLFVFASNMEGFGLPPLEAMASGIAVISTGVGAIPEYMTPSSGVLIKPNSSKEVWLSQILNLVNNKNKRIELGAAAYIQAQNYTWEKTTLKYLELIK
jgi:glycosyltransferase involved in cell wall biosynthesis